MRLKLRGLSIGVMAFVVGAGVSYGLPHSMVMSSVKPSPGHTSSTRAHSPEPEETEAPESTESPRADSDPNASKFHALSDGPHGAAVSAAAHCALHGSAHGALVSSIAAGADATVDQANSACTAAGGTVRGAPGMSGQAHAAVHGKSDEAHGKSGMVREPRVHSTEQ
jgi:hypothetical protein